MSELVTKLADAQQPVSVERYTSLDEFDEAISRGFVLVKFTETQGGTELGFRVDTERSDLSQDEGGKVTLVGPLVLDYVPVECTVTIDRSTLTGVGSVAVAESA